MRLMLTIFLCACAVQADTLFFTTVGDTRPTSLGAVSVGGGGPTSYALQFDGADDVLKCSTNINAGLFAAKTQMTFTCWLKLDKIGATQAMNWKVDAANSLTCFRFYMSSGDNSLYWQVYNDAGGNEYAGPSGTLVSNVWYFLAAVADDTKLRIYTNGIQSASANYTGNIRPSNGHMGIGDAPYSPVYPTDGTIDEPTFWTRGLASNEIFSLYNSGAGRYGTNNLAPWNTNMVFLAHCDEGAGTNVTDFSTNNYPGTIVGATWVTGKVVP